MDFFLYCAVIWFFYYLINHSLIFQKLRLAAMPALPQWLQTMISCSFCLAFWTTAALSLFAGFSAVVFAAPPCVLFADLAYRKLGGPTDEGGGAEFSARITEQIQKIIREEIEKQSRPDGILSQRQKSEDQSQPPLLK